MRCDCKHEGQDALYGPGMRVWNALADGKNFVCTVCGKLSNGGYKKEKK